jgi:hypothetical protein
MLARWRIAVRDGSRLLSLLARALRTAVVGDAPAPGLALLAGPPTVRAGTPTVYVVRLCNPTSRPARLRLVADGTSSATYGSSFHSEHVVDVPPRATARYRLVTAWDGRASVTPELDGEDAPADDALADGREALAHCDVHVRLVDRGRTVDHLQVRAALHA